MRSNEGRAIDFREGVTRVFLPILANTHSREQVTIVAGYVEVRDGDRRWHMDDARNEERGRRFT